MLVLPQRQAALAAKQIATIDLLSGGRLRVAVGVGWNFAEYEGLGADFSDRVDSSPSRSKSCAQLWTEPIIRYEGRFHHLDGVGINPLPTRRIPIYIGTGGSDAALRRVVRTADGWMPLLLPGLDPIDFRTGVERLRQLAVDADRDPGDAADPRSRRISATDGRSRSTKRSRSGSRTCRSASTEWRIVGSLTRSISTPCSP